MGYGERIDLHYWQTKAYESEARFLLLVSGTQGGKTFFGPVWLAKNIKEHREDNYLIAAPTYKMLHQSTLPMFLELARRNIKGKWNEAKQEYQLAGGGRIFMRSAEDPDSLEAMTLRGAWLDEVGKMKARVWNVMNSRLAINKGSLLMTTTPYSLNWVYYEIYKRWMAGDKDYEVFQFKSIDSPYFPADEFERMRRTLSEIEFRRRFCGEFLKAEGIIYQGFSRGKNVIDEFEIPEKWYKFGGIDFGYTAPTGAVYCALSPKGEVIVYDEYYENKRLLGDHAEDLKVRGSDRVKDGIKLFGDKSAAQEIAELQALDVRVVPAIQEISVNVGISRIDRMFSSGKIKIFRRCRNLIDEIEGYSWQDSNDEIENTKDKVRKKKDHLVDGLRYAITNTSAMIREGYSETRRPSYPIASVLDNVTGLPLIGSADNEYERMDEFMKLFNIKLKVNGGNYNART